MIWNDTLTHTLNIYKFEISDILNKIKELIELFTLHKFVCQGIRQLLIC